MDMELIRQAISALTTGLLPVGGLSFALVWWAASQRYIEVGENVGQIGKAMKTLTREQKKARKARKKNAGRTSESPPPKPRKFDRIHEKWMAFGGGFYGVVSIYTYLRVEWRELVDFVSQFGGLLAMLGNISVNALIGLLINSILNFVTAVTWPLYWFARVPSEWLLLWLVTAYAGFWLGAKLALLSVSRNWTADWRSSTPPDDPD